MRASEDMHTAGARRRPSCRLGPGEHFWGGFGFRDSGGFESVTSAGSPVGVATAEAEPMRHAAFLEDSEELRTNFRDVAELQLYAKHC